MNIMNIMKFEMFHLNKIIIPSSMDASVSIFETTKYAKFISRFKHCFHVHVQCMKYILCTMALSTDIVRCLGMSTSFTYIKTNAPRIFNENHTSLCVCVCVKYTYEAEISNVQHCTPYTQATTNEISQNSYL